MPDAAAVRSMVGPYAWVVFEDMAASLRTGDSPVVKASVRSVAARLAMSKDTVARALARLVEAGLIERRVDREAESGRFGTSSYRLHLGSEELVAGEGEGAAEGLALAFVDRRGVAVVDVAGVEVVGGQLDDPLAARLGRLQVTSLVRRGRR
jgi:DNA-binding transcriptional ArsR family regulator